MWKATRLLASVAVFAVGSVPSLVRAQDYTVVAVSHTDNRVSEVNPLSGKTLRQYNEPLEWFGELHEGAITKDSKTMYVSVPYLKKVLVLDLETFKPKATIESEYFSRPPETRTFARNVKREVTSGDPHGVALNADESKLYVTVEFAEVPGIVVVDLKTGKSKKIDTIVCGNWLGVNPKTDKLYMPNRNGSDSVTVIDTKTDRVIRVIPMARNSVPEGTAFGGPNNEVWISGDGDGSITVIDGTTDKVLKVLQPRVKGAGRIAASPDGRWVASAAGGEVSIVDTKTREIVASLNFSPTTPQEGHGYPIFSPDSNTLHVVNESSNDMATFDLRDFKKPGTRSETIGGASFGGGIRRLSR